jgi:hypothetical protein
MHGFFSAYRQYEYTVHAAAAKATPCGISRGVSVARHQQRIPISSGSRDESGPDVKVPPLWFATTVGDI